MNDVQKIQSAAQNARQIRCNRKHGASGFSQIDGTNYGAHTSLQCTKHAPVHAGVLG
jgi:hypothetical protein